MDRISSLPDEITSHILSFLPTKMAAQASVFSKRWRIQFAFSPNLDLLDYNEDNPQSFMDFVDRVLAMSGNSLIKKLSLRCRKGVEPAHISGVLYLNLDLDRDRNSLPFEVFTCKTLVNLKLTGIYIDVLPDDVCLPALKTFSLYSDLLCSLQAYGFEKLLLRLPCA